MPLTNPVRELASLFRVSNSARPLLLLGAGASFSSGVPLAAESVRRLARRIFAERVTGGAMPPEHVKLSEWQPWLQAHDWFLKGEERLAENFPLVAQHLLRPREYRARLLLDLLQPTSGLGPGYKHLAGLMMRGLVHTVLTTNLDPCLSHALNDRHPHIRHVAEVNRGPDDLREFSIFNRAQIVWLHGRVEQYTDRNLLHEVGELEPKLVDLLHPLLDASPLVVLGYRGSEPSIMEHLLTKNATRTHDYRNGIYWCVLRGETLHPRVESLRGLIGGNFRLVEIAGFDELMEELADILRDEDAYQGVRAPESGSHAVSYDDRGEPSAALDELDCDLMLTVMREYCSKLARAPVTRETLPALLKEQGLLIDTDGKVVPTVGCILLFGKDPQSRFPHAVVSVSVCGKKRSVFAGNLIRQRSALLEWLDAPEVNPRLRVKRRTMHEEKLAYPPRALVELVVNMLVHRDYSASGPSIVEIHPGDGITFSNPGGLVDAVARRVTFDEGGCFRPLPNVSELRNRALCDIFFGIQAMERQGTGLSDVEAMARDLGGRASFAHDGRESGTFLAHIFQPLASVGSKTVARHDRPTGVYVFNVLPFASIPSQISVVKLKVRLSDRPNKIVLDGLGTFVLRDNELWTFVQIPILKEVLGSILDIDGSKSFSRSEVEQDAEARKVLSWLLRKHFERGLSQFKDLGLVLEGGKRNGKRAYFEGREGRPRTIVYDTPRRRRVKRQVVKQRAEAPNVWFENEGFGYDIVQIDEVWGVRLKPFYMFTGRDARTPLPTFTRTSRATRRMKFDRNKSVDDDLTFWGRFLAPNVATINIGQEHVDDLLLEGSFLTVEVSEEGLLGENDESKDRLPA